MLLISSDQLITSLRKVSNTTKSDSLPKAVIAMLTSPMSPYPAENQDSSERTCEETHLSVNTDEVQICDGPHFNNGQNRTTNNTTNGSIITMTLKNNHLIVETEERNDIDSDSRETTMKYSPSARDGVFVVEVQQGNRRSPSSSSGAHCTYVEPEVSISDQCAVVHNPPGRYSDEETLEECDDPDYFLETATPEDQSTPTLSIETKTGLAQSDTSLSSSMHNTYCYTNQQGYDHGSYGYNSYTGYVVDEPQKRLPSENENKPKIMSAIYKTSFRYDSLDLPGMFHENLEINQEPLPEESEEISKTTD